MLSEHLLMPTRNIPCGMLLTQLFKHFKINLFDERTINPFIDINNTFLKRMQMHVGAHVQDPSHPSSPPVQHFVPDFSFSVADPYAGMMTQLSDLSLQITSFIERIVASQEAMRREQQNDMA